MNILQMRLQSVSAPFDAGSKVELKFVVTEYDATGELYLRISAAKAQSYRLGDVYIAQVTQLP